MDDNKIIETSDTTLECPYEHGKYKFDISKGDITIGHGVDDTNKITVIYGNPQMTTVEFDPSQKIIISGTSSKGKIIVNGGGTLTHPIRITLRNVDIVRSQDGGTCESPGSCAIDLQNRSFVELTLEGANQLKGGWRRPGVGVSSNATLIITAESTGSLIAGCEGHHGAAIGGHVGERSGNITINGGKITANGGRNSSGIGSSFDSKGAGNITINGGTVIAQCGNPAIGGARPYGIQGDTVTINGGTVTAWGNDAGIHGRTVITGGTITATGDKGIDGTLSTGGNAFIVTSSISGKSEKENWGGIVFQGNNGSVYGSPSIVMDAEISALKRLTIDKNKTLTISKGITLTNNCALTINGTLINNGTIINNGEIDGEGTLANCGTISGSGKIDYNIHCHSSH